ncbi:hypothetical protein Zmor_023115 [Zophobas morio]|uniref:Uncharacterized protein n=1 Tax=Zophobas morio TaxID=2755281 RepID=A0AA38I012_9CUCU|nr:hypothetical protein Zmor_023115 [Zophobas morio]
MQRRFIRGHEEDLSNFAKAKALQKARGCHLRRVQKRLRCVFPFPGGILIRSCLFWRLASLKGTVPTPVYSLFKDGVHTSCFGYRLVMT